MTRRLRWHLDTLVATLLCRYGEHMMKQVYRRSHYE